MPSARLPLHPIPHDSMTQAFPQLYTYTCWSLCLEILPYSPSPPCPQVRSLHLCLYSCPATRFISTVFFFLIPYICVSIWYLFFSFWLHSVWQILGPNTSLQITQFHFFLYLSNIPLYICATSSLSIHLLMDILVSSNSWLCKILMQCRLASLCLLDSGLLRVIVAS